MIDDITQLLEYIKEYEKYKDEYEEELPNMKSALEALWLKSNVQDLYPDLHGHIGFSDGYMNIDWCNPTWGDWDFGKPNHRHICSVQIGEKYIYSTVGPDYYKYNNVYGSCNSIGELYDIIVPFLKEKGFYE